MVLMRKLLTLIECKSKLFRGNRLNINRHEDDGGFDQKIKKEDDGGFTQIGYIRGP